jgi:hypothetical protein
MTHHLKNLLFSKWEIVAHCAENLSNTLTTLPHTCSLWFSKCVTDSMFYQSFTHHCWRGRYVPIALGTGAETVRLELDLGGAYRLMCVCVMSNLWSAEVFAWLKWSVQRSNSVLKGRMFHSSYREGCFQMLLRGRDLWAASADKRCSIDGRRKEVKERALAKGFWLSPKSRKESFRMVKGYHKTGHCVRRRLLCGRYLDSGHQYNKKS